MTSKKYRAPLLHYKKLCASFQTPRWMQTGVTIRKPSIRVKIGDFFVPCELEILWMTLKNNRAPLLCYLKLCASFQSHRWIQSGNAQFGSKSAIFFVPCDLEIWWMNLKNNRTPLRCYVKLCASFQNHQWIQTEVTVRKHSIRVKIGDLFCPVWPWNLMDEFEKR